MFSLDNPHAVSGVINRSETMKTLSLALLAVASLAVAAPAFAQPVNQRDADQQSRINQGVASGQLTAGETARDQGHLNSIERQTARMRARNGGHLTRGERRYEQHRLSHNSRRIYRTKHNGRVG
jgi:hypothetical protein